jgi:hypothetical protein
MKGNYPIWQLAKPFKQHVSGKAKISSHFTVRLYQRFDLVARLKALIELERFVTSEAWKIGMDVGYTARIHLTGITIVAQRTSDRLNGERLKLVTIWPA